MMEVRIARHAGSGNWVASPQHDHPSRIEDFELRDESGVIARRPGDIEPRFGDVVDEPGNLRVMGISP